ncbi:MAG: hypothetical protein WBE76_02935 [Terracidiphilus sp.]
MAEDTAAIAATPMTNKEMETITRNILAFMGEPDLASARAFGGSTGARVYLEIFAVVSALSYVASMYLSMVCGKTGVSGRRETGNRRRVTWLGATRRSTAPAPWTASRRFH